MTRTKGFEPLQDGFGDHLTQPTLVPIKKCDWRDLNPHGAVCSTALSTQPVYQVPAQSQSGGGGWISTSDNRDPRSL